MKKACILAIVFMIVMATACAGDSSRGENIVTYDNTMAPLPTWENRRGEYVARAWQARIENILQAESITRVEYTVYHSGEKQIYFSEDRSIIERWETLLTQLRCSVVPLLLYYGAPGVSLAFYKNENKIQLLTGHSMPNILYIEEGWTEDNHKMLRIDNFDEIEDDFMAILSDMGVKIWMPIE